MARYDFGSFSTMAKAEAALEDAFSTGDILPGERPEIETRSTRVASWDRSKPRYVITLEDYTGHVDTSRGFPAA